MADTRERLIIEAIIEGNAIQQLNKLERETVDYARKSRVALEGVEQGFLEVGRSSTRAATAVDRGMRRASASVGGFRKSIGALIPGIRTLIASVVGIAAIGGAVRSASQYQIALAEVGTIAGISAGQLDLMARATQEVTQEFGLSALSGIQAQYQAISAGVQAGAQSTLFLAESSRLAIAGVTDLTSSVKTLTAITNAYGREFGDVAEVSDILFNTVRLGVTTIPELSTVIGDVIPPAAALGIELEQVFAAIAALTKSGASTAEVGTQLKAVFTQLANSTSAASQQLTKFGIPIEDLTGDFLGLLDAISGLSADEIAQTFGSNVRAFLPILNLTGQLRGEFVSFVEQIKNGSGAVEGALQQFFETPAFQARQSVNKFRDAFRTIGDGLIDGFNTAVERAGGADIIAKQIESFGSVAAVFASELLNVVGDTIKFVDDLANRAGGIEKLTDVFASFFRLVATGIRAFGSLTRGLILGIADLIAGVVENLDGLSQAFSYIIPDGTLEAVKSLGAALGGIVGEDTVKQFKELGDAGDEFLASLAALQANAGGEIQGPDVKAGKFAALEELFLSEGGGYALYAEALKRKREIDEQAAIEAARRQEEIITAAAQRGIVAVEFQTDAAAQLYQSLIESIAEFGLREDQRIALQLKQSRELIAGLREEESVRQALTVRVEEAARIQLAAAAAAAAGQTRVTRTQEEVQRQVQSLTLALFEQGLAFEDAIDVARGYGFALQDGVQPALEAAREAAFDWADAQNSANLTARATTAAFDTVSNGLGTAFADIVTGAKSADDAIKAFVASALAELSRLASQAAFRNLIGNIAGSFAAPGANLAIGSSASGAAATSFATGAPTLGTGVGSIPTLPFADGGGVTRISGFTPISRTESNSLLAGGLPGYANGSGPISSPHLAVVGEGRFSEFVVPTPDGKSIPIKQVGTPPRQSSSRGEGDGGGNMQVTINLRVESLDPRRAGEIITQPETMRRIEESLTATLTRGTNRGFSRSVADA